MYRTKRIGRSVWFLAAAMFCVFGCTNSRTGLKWNGLPARKYLVGGGFMVSYTAPQSGIAYLVEQKTKKLFKMKSLKQGEVFEQSIDVSRRNIADELKKFGIDPATAEFKLYFVPGYSQKSSYDRY